MARFVELVSQVAGSVWGGGGTWGGGGSWGDCFRALQLPIGLTLKDNNLDFKVDREDLPFADGRVSYGEEVEERKIAAEGYVVADTRESLLSVMNALRYQAQIAKRLRINSGHYINLARLRGIDDEAEAGFDRTLTRVKIEWQVDDPFWYAEDLQAREFSISGDTTLLVDLTGLPDCFRGQHPQIIIQSPIYLPVGSVTLTNNSDGGLVLRYSDPSLGLGNSATIDCALATAKRSDGENTIRYFEGEWLRLVPGLNRISYVGPACTLTFKWRHRWL